MPIEMANYGYPKPDGTRVLINPTACAWMAVYGA